MSGNIYSEITDDGKGFIEVDEETGEIRVNSIPHSGKYKGKKTGFE